MHVYIWYTRPTGYLMDCLLHRERVGVFSATSYPWWVQLAACLAGRLVRPVQHVLLPGCGLRNVVALPFTEQAAGWAVLEGVRGCHRQRSC
jgi:hypothetical protein